MIRDGHVVFGMRGLARLCGIDDMTLIDASIYADLATEPEKPSCDTCIVMLRAGVEGETSGRLTVVDAGGNLHGIPLRDLKAARGCRFSSCAQRMTPCSQHPRTEWGA